MSHSCLCPCLFAAAADSNGDAPELPNVLAALKHAAELLYHHDLSMRYDALLAGQSEDQLGPEVAQALAQGKQVTQQQLELAQVVQKEVQVGLLQFVSSTRSGVDCGSS